MYRTTSAFSAFGLPPVVIRNSIANKLAVLVDNTEALNKSVSGGTKNKEIAPFRTTILLLTDVNGRLDITARNFAVASEVQVGSGGAMIAVRLVLAVATIPRNIIS